MNEMNEKNDKQVNHYAQIGVAMTCRSYAEYVRMFDLNEEQLRRGPILDVGAGASSFTAEALARGLNAIAADPMYSLSPEGIQAKGSLEIEESTAKLAAIQQMFDWSYYGSIDQHRASRTSSLALFTKRFSEDHSLQEANGAIPKRFISAVLPNLPFKDQAFVLVLCSHFLFLYQEQFDFDFHEAALKELFRVCRPGGEVRVYPLISLRWSHFPRLDELMSSLAHIGISCSLEPSHLPFIPGSNQMLVMRHRQKDKL